jgi:predicted nucleic acid-binding protein
MSAKRRPSRVASRVRQRPPGSASKVDDANATIRYIETSALIAGLVESDAPARRALNGPGRVVTSALTHAEAGRAIQRARTASRFGAAEANRFVVALRSFAETCETVPVSSEVLARVGQPFPVEPVRSLDAIHLATVELLGLPPSSVIFVTRDARVRANAKAFGWATE